MTYIAEKPVTETKERQLITIEFAPDIHPSETEYQYEHPQFVFGDRVIIINTYPELEFTVCALELIESKTPSGRLLNQPYWKYKISNGKVSFWKDESALTRYTQKTCLTCSEFNNYQDNYGRGWCRQFDHPAKTHHKKTNDCIVNGALELDLPHAEYQVGNIVKIIDPDENYTEWAIFEVIECMHNRYLYRSTETYLHQPEWYYRLSSYTDGNTMPSIDFALDKSLWVAENEICSFDMAHNVCTDDIF
ncbi:MAG: hypothetical protein HC939_24345 [Pleurocapsa sp. SU_5_0]|nr:hypothetical protein [Pleurocapsa sp. SU_5_0]